MQTSAKTLARRQLERQIIEDGTAIWKTKREIELLLAAEEKKQVNFKRHESLSSASPPTIIISSSYLIGLIYEKINDFLNDRKSVKKGVHWVGLRKQWMMLATYNPWGKPGHGAPMPGALRKTKWIMDAHNNEDGISAVTLGRPGHGAPLRTPSGKTKTFIKADPLIRFQLHDSARRAVENDLRYRATPSDKENYRKELDAIVCQKKQKKPEEVLEDTTCEKQKGWTNNDILSKLSKDVQPAREREQIYEITGGGVELVPLLAKHRMVTRCPLPTTDITRMSRICNDLPKTGFTGQEYFRELCHQVDEREKQKQKEQKEDVIESRKHFETWKGLWGRPGHGAPKALSQREKLEFLLYRMPSRRIVSTTTKSP